MIKRTVNGVTIEITDKGRLCVHVHEHKASYNMDIINDGIIYGLNQFLGGFPMSKNKTE